MARYFGTNERVVAALLLASLGAFAWTLPSATSHLAYPSSRAQDLYVLSRDIGAFDVVSRIERAEKPEPEELYALGLRALWRGDLKDARWLLQSAIDRGARYAELYTTLGNVHHALDDNRRAIAAFKEATRIAPEHVLAYYNLSRVYFSMTDHQRASEVHRQASAVDYDRVEELNNLTRLHGRQYLVPEPPPAVLLGMSAGDSGLHTLAVQQAWRWLGGAATRQQFGLMASLSVLFVLGLAWFKRRGGVPNSCERCGGAACKRCHPHLPNLQLCGTCHRAFVSRPPGTEQARISKQIEGHRHYARQRRVQQVLLVFGAGLVQLVRGSSLLGVVILLLSVTLAIVAVAGAGLLPEPAVAPTYEPVSLLSTAVAALVALVLYVVGLWDGRREGH